jgi:PAS domain S-box-containing protein
MFSAQIERPQAHDHTDHWVQFYESDAFLADKVVSFVADGLAVGESAVLIATEPHRVLFAERLRAVRSDLDQLLESGRVVMLDARTVLGTLMVDGVPDADAFTRNVGNVVMTMARATPGKPLRAYGEMVDVLWRRGDKLAALRLEELWNELRLKVEFKLLCAYGLEAFFGGGGLSEVCGTHSHVLSPERVHADAPDIRALVAEIALRTETERQLRRVNAELRIAQERERATKEDLEELLDTAAIAIHRVDPDGIIRYANRAELEMLGYTADEYVGRHITEFHVDMPVIEDMLVRLTRGETLRDHEARLRTKDGSIRHVQVNSNIQQRTGERPLTRCFTRDVTALKEAELDRAQLLAQAQAARADAEQANRAKDEFLAVLGHELRNPLSPILSAVQLMRLRGEERTQREQNIIERQVDHLVHIVDDLLDIARITQGKLELDNGPVEVRGLVTKAIEMTAPACNERKHRTTVVFDESGLWVEGDETRLCQVLTNLLTNAAKYTPPGGTIDVRVFRDSTDVCISVRDTGAGIATDVLPRIFDPFMQEHRISKRGVGGLGIGLALVKSLVGMHGGKVLASSAGPGLGSEFVVRLPVLEVKATRSPADLERPLRERIAVTPRKVLVIDDNEDAAMLLGEMLRAIGHEVVVAHAGEEALDAVQRFTPDAAIVDIGLPGMSGYDVAAQLRRRFGATLRLMAVTGYGQAHDRMRAFEAGFDLHFLKPVSVQKVLAEIELARPA